MKICVVFIFYLFISFLASAQEDPRYYKILEQVNQNLNINYDTNIFMEFDFKELIFDKRDLLQYIDIQGFNSEEGRPNFKQLTPATIYYKSAFRYNLGKNLQYRDRMEFVYLTTPNRKAGNNFFQIKHSLFVPTIQKFQPIFDFSHSSEVLTNKGTVTDTLFDGKDCYFLERIALVEYFKNKGKKTTSIYHTYIHAITIINKSDYAILFKLNDYFLTNADSSLKYKSRSIDTFKRLGNHYFLEKSYFITPRYVTNHKFSYNSRGLYTFIIRQSKPTQENEQTKTLPKMPFEPYKKFCKKIDKVPESALKIYDDAKQFINEPFPNFEFLKLYLQKVE